MKTQYLIFAGLAVFFCAACQPNMNQFMPRAAIAPGMNALGGLGVQLAAVNVGNVQNLNMRAMLPPGSTGSLIDHSGPLRIQGTIRVQRIPCLGSANYPFNCQAQAAVGNITTNSCVINGQNIFMKIALQRGRNLQNPYSINAIILDAPPNCHNPQFARPGFNQPVLPGAVPAPPVVF